MENFIKNATGLTKNPLGIIALFISLIYGFACLVLSTSISNLKGETERLPLIWFIILFPIVILICFIFLVARHHGKLYSPSDYGSSEAFLKTLAGAKKFESIQIESNEINARDTNIEDIVKKAENNKFNKSLFLPETKQHLALVNKVWNLLHGIFKDEISKNLLGLGYGIQSPEYFIFSFVINKDFLKSNIKTSNERKENVIVRVTEKEGSLYLIAIGKDIVVKDNPFEFADKFQAYIRDKINKVLEEDNSNDSKV